jgi:glutamine amidotransferase
MKTVIVDYGIGNLWSVKSAFEYVGADVVISSDKAVISAAECIVLPGVGSYRCGVENLHNLDLVGCLNEVVLKKKVPTLGICLGMQLFSDESEEAPGVSGLGWVHGKVLRMNPSPNRLPHIGFNLVTPSPSEIDNTFFKKSNQLDFYFVHSYHFHLKEQKHMLATCSYGKKFVAAIAKDNIIGVQFHPEKSQSSGLWLISEFLSFSAKYKNG